MSMRSCIGSILAGINTIVTARLSDGTWSAPRRRWKRELGFGIQSGVEVKEYAGILRSQESLDYFCKGHVWNLGAALAGNGREAYGAAIVNVKEDECNDDKDRDGKEWLYLGWKQRKPRLLFSGTCDCLEVLVLGMLKLSLAAEPPTNKNGGLRTFNRCYANTTPLLL